MILLCANFSMMWSLPVSSCKVFFAQWPLAGLVLALCHRVSPFSAWQTKRWQQINSTFGKYMGK